MAREAKSIGEMELNVCLHLQRLERVASRPSQIERADCACVSAGRLGHRRSVGKQMQSCKQVARSLVRDYCCSAWRALAERQTPKGPEGADKEMRVPGSLLDHPKERDAIYPML